MAQDTATVTVSVLDPSFATVPGATVSVKAAGRDQKLVQETEKSGYVLFENLGSGTYEIQVEKKGFETVRLERVELGVRDRQNLVVMLKIASSETAVDVRDRVGGISTDSSTGISVDQNYFENLPVNGRSLDALVLMTPGISTAQGGRSGGGFNANGLRENMNYYTLDGVSVGASAAAPGGSPPGPGGEGRGGGAAVAAGQTANGAISLDAMQEMRVQTSSFAPEFGRTPGAQVVMTSRSGNNDFHGSLYEYYRNDQFNANDWFANSRGFQPGEMRQNRYGATLGGPVSRDHTFFFAAFEGLNLHTPLTIISQVPNLVSRRAAKATLRPFLNAFPEPNGPDLGSGAAEFHAVVSNPSDARSGSLRLDHTFNATNSVFARYSYTKTTGSGRQGEFSAANIVRDREVLTHAATAGYTHVFGSGSINDLRANFTRTNGSSTSIMDAFGNAVPLTDARVFPAGVTSATGNFNLNVPGLSSYSLGAPAPTRQQQINIVDSLSRNVGSHSYKIGFDWRYITPADFRKTYTTSVTFRSLGTGSDSLLSGIATNASVSSSLPEVDPVYQNFSFFGQDAWRLSERTTLTYGLRWDVNPAPWVRNGPKPFAQSTSTVAGVTQNDPLYQTKWFNFAPRLGIVDAWDERPGRELILRAGAGLFYDLGYGTTAAAFSGAPYANVLNYTTVDFPLTPTLLAAPSLPPQRPYGQVTTADRNLESPMIIQWSVSVERSLGLKQSLTIGYTGTRSDNLVRNETQPAYSDAYNVLRLTTNGALSRYHGLQVQFRRRLSANLQTQISYTYSHSIDSASNDAGFAGGGGFATIFGAGQRGSSDFDIRHNLNFSGTYRLPAPKGLAFILIRDWNLDWLATARTGLPFDIQGISAQASGTGTSGSTTNPRGPGIFASVRPDYNGLPVWVADPNVPGGQRVNAAAFTAPTGFSQGNLGRNALRGFGAGQVDLSIRRQIPLGERVRINLALQAFNVTNRPNFATLSPFEGANLSSPAFGIVNRMLNQGFGGAGGVYSTGGPRQIELSLRVQF